MVVLGFSEELEELPLCQALKEGDVLLRLTASDGLYFAMSECPTHIEGTVDAT